MSNIIVVALECNALAVFTFSRCATAKRFESVKFTFVVILPFWSVLNIFEGYFQDIFYGLLVMNWIFGGIMFFIARSIMIKTFNEEKKVFFIF